MRPHDAPRPPAGVTGGRASDRAIASHVRRFDPYPVGTLARVLRTDAPRVCPCEVCSPQRRPAWVLRDDLEPMTFDELVASGMVDVDSLAVPVVEVSR